MIFEREESIIPEILKPEFEDTEHYKKLAFKKYLDGELDIHSLNNIFISFEGKQNERHDKNIAYR